MGLAEDIVSRSRKNTERQQLEQRRQEALNDPTAIGNSYRNHLIDFREKEKLDSVSQREIALENRKQLGQLAMQNAANKGGIDKQSLMNKGDMATWNARLNEGGRQFDASLGFDRMNKNREFGLAREKESFDQFAKLRGLDSQDDMLGGGDGAKPNLSQDWFKYRESSSGLTDKDIGTSIAHTLATGGKLSEAQSDWVRANAGGGPQAGGGGASANSSSMRYDTLTREDGTVERYDQRGNRVPSQVNENSAAPIGTSKVQTPPPIKKRKTPTYIPSNAMPRPFGNSFIRSNIGHTLGVDKAHDIATGLNRAATGAWDLSNKVGNTIIERGIKPAAKWATQEYDDPYRKK